MFINNNVAAPKLDWEIVNLSSFDSIVIMQRDLFEVRASRIRVPDATEDLTIAKFKTKQEARKFIDLLFEKLEAGCQTTDRRTLVEQFEEGLSSP